MPVVSWHPVQHSDWLIADDGCGKCICWLLCWRVVSVIVHCRVKHLWSRTVVDGFMLLPPTSSLQSELANFVRLEREPIKRTSCSVLAWLRQPQAAYTITGIHRNTKWLIMKVGRILRCNSLALFTCSTNFILDCLVIKPKPIQLSSKLFIRSEDEDWGRMHNRKGCIDLHVWCTVETFNRRSN